MNRFETKFVLPAREVDALLNILCADYSPLLAGGTMLQDYETRYFDTEDLRFYHEHHHQSLGRMKIRTRHYRNTGTRYLEIKVKDNRRMTSKSRMMLGPDDVALDSLPALAAQVPDVPHGSQLHEVLRVEYRRLSLMSETHQERISIDLDIGASSAVGAARYRLREMAIVEVKQLRPSRHSPAWLALRALQRRPSMASKYCLSCALLFAAQVRTNRFKPMLRSLGSYIDARGDVTA